MHDHSYAESHTLAAALVAVRDGALAAAPYGMFICAADGTFEAVNPAFEKLTGFIAGELVGRRTFCALHDPAELARRRAELPPVATIGPRYEGEWNYLRRNGSTVRVLLALAPYCPESRASVTASVTASVAASGPRPDLRFHPSFNPRVDARAESHTESRVVPRPDSRAEPRTNKRAESRADLRVDPLAGRPMRYIGIAIDMTRYAQSEARLWYVAHHDGVTRLPNQTLFTERLELTITRCQRNGGGFTVLIAELDHLRKLRDTLGLHAAELVLQIVGERLRGLFPNDGTIASIGGTQFALVINETGAAADAFAADALCRIAEAIDYAGTALNITASIGLVAYPADGGDALTLMRRAGVALSAASAVHGNAVRRFSAALEGQAARRFELETMLRDALEHQQLHLVYQPQVTLSNGRIAQVEALLRWNHPQRGFISPAEFVPVAEEAGLIEQIGDWVIRTACREAGKLLRLTGNLPRVAINVSPQQFQKRDLFETIRDALDAAALEPSYLEVEITEGVLLGDTDQALHTLHALRELGVEVAVDDFGTGYSSLAYLTRFPLNRIKIDRSFVMRMSTDPQCAALVGAIIAMAHALKLRVTAEGVETAEQAAQLEALGCDETQGFWFSRPVTIAALRNLLRPLGTI